MKNQLFIPEKIKVGYVKREDTYTKRLAYIIYYDQEGVLRKEGSWQGWRDKNIQPDDFENKPHSGFILNKDVKRDSGWFGSGRNMIRVYDDRGIEFEITTGNLLFILMTTNCHKRGLEGDFVYAWIKKDLILLPVGCEEYQNSVQFTSLQDKSVSVKSLVPGCSYQTKKQENLIYLGRFDYYVCTYEYVDGNYNNYNQRKLKNFKSKKFIFINNENKIVALDKITSLAIQTTDIPVSNYAEFMEIYSKSIHASPVKSITSEPCENLNLNIPDNRYYHNVVSYKEIEPGKKYKRLTFELRYRNYDIKAGIVDFESIENSDIYTLDNEINIDSRFTRDTKKISKDAIESMQSELCRLFVVTENNGKIPFEEIATN